MDSTNKEILVIDDHPLLRHGVIGVLSRHFPQATFSEADSAAAAVAAVKTKLWDLALLDLNLDDRSGLELLVEMKTVRPSVPVLVLTMHPAEAFSVAALKAGAAGYLVKGCAVNVLVEAVTRVLAGDVYITPGVGTVLAAELRPKANPKHLLLSKRELTVFARLGAGDSVGLIAHDLGVSVKTISTYRTRILEKMGLKGNAEIVRYLCEHQLTDIS